MKMSLPLLIKSEYKLLGGAAMWLFAAIIYLSSNHFHLFTPQLLPMLAIDNATPFIPETFWIYFSEYFLFGAAFLMCRDATNLNKYFYSFMGLQVFSNIIFVLWPTTFPRELFPIPANIDSITGYAFNSLRQTDTPANCCPSLHVSSVYLSSLIFLDEKGRGWKFPLFFLWATAIGISTLTTKQHYFVDVAAGLALALGFYWLFHKKLSYKRQ